MTVDHLLLPTMNLTRKRKATLAAVAVLLAGAILDSGAVTPAATPAFQGTNFTLDGKITEHTAGKLTVSTEENIIFRVRYTDKTEIKHQDGSAGSEKDLRVGVMIHVDGDLNDSGEISAQRIEIQPGPAPAK